MTSSWVQFAGLLIPLAVIIFKGWMADRERAREHADLKKDVKDNTALTVQAGEKADAAYQEANDVNTKLARLGVKPIK